MKYLFLIYLCHTTVAADDSTLKKNIKFQKGSEAVLWQYSKKHQKIQEPFVVKMICQPAKTTVRCTYMGMELYSFKDSFEVPK